MYQSQSAQIPYMPSGYTYGSSGYPKASLKGAWKLLWKRHDAVQLQIVQTKCEQVTEGLTGLCQDEGTRYDIESNSKIWNR